MVMMMLDLGTTIAVWGTALAIIPFLDVIIDWFCIGVPALRSPATRMRVLHDSLNSTRALLEKNKRELEAVYLGPDFDLPSKWDGIQTAANKLEVLVKGGGWKRYSVAHLLCCTRTVIRLNDRLNSVTKDLVTFNKKVFTALDTSLDPPSECPETAAAWLARRLRSLFNVPRVVSHDDEKQPLASPRGSQTPRPGTAMSGRTAVATTPGDGDGERQLPRDDPEQTSRSTSSSYHSAEGCNSENFED